LAAETVGVRDVDQLPAIEQYRILVAASNVDPSFVFPEFPPIARQCELQGIWNEYSKLELANPSADVQVILDERDQSNRYFNIRWQILTRESELVGPPYPPVARLTQLIAPIPYTSTWTAELYGREAVSMRHAVARGQPGAAAPIPSTGPSGGSPSAGAVTGAGPGCNVEDIYRLAGASAPHQPSSPQPDAESAHHTFPGNLRWGEDIFYDYSVMMPLGQCDLDAAPPEFDERRTMAATMSANFAQNILAFLYAQHLDAALGAGVIAELEQQLTAVLGIRVDATTAHVRALRKGLRETAAVVRSLSRMRMLFAAPVVEDFNQLITALDAALTPFDATRLRNPERYLPNSHATEGNQPHGVLRPTLEIIDTADPLNNFYAHVRDNDFFYENGDDLHDGAKPAGWFGVPHAKSNRPENGVFFGGTFEASYSTTRRHEALRRYLQYLGGTFYNNLTTLRERANDARAALDRVRNAPRSRNVLSEFARFSEGVVNEALMALAQLFDDMAEQLPLARSTKAEGSKRLARMVTYRQYWFPEGYVAGKLVGYKNLMPNQKETVKRRTFVKTTRDLTTAEEFAASRDQDFTSSTKETAELVKEASSEFNLSVKTEGGFDFLIVSGDITTDVSTGRKDVSKAMHNRVAEATMKSSIKYNEKREVKLRELTETESLQEVTTEIENLNREITANYFYYQLHRQYVVTTELARVQTVLLRTREVPSPAAVDAKFLSDHAHILLHALPGQLSADLQEAVGEVDLLGRTVIRRRGDLDQKRAMYEQFRLSPMPAAAEEQAAWRAQLDAMERASSEAITAYVEADENYIRARTRIDRVVGHVRENIHYYMQFIWYASPNTDQDKLLQEEEFDHRPLGELTRGFMRVGYYGNEEIFEYTGSSLDGLQ
ncbi:MAG: hypothetical protein ABI837_15485, partial [Acidobacteriota bacterium]